MPRLAPFLAIVSLLLALAAPAEVYRWTDAEGNLHFAQDLSRVPAEHRSQAARGTSAPERGSVQTYEPPAPAASGDRGTAARAPLHIPFEAQGTLMRVEALVNGRLKVPFFIDTGASGVSLPSQVVADLGIPIRSDTDRITIRTANGLARVPLVSIDSIDLGGARVEGLQATVNPSIPVGLLGGSFFNNYRYSVDAAAGVITLVPNEGVRAGVSAMQWRDRFSALQSDIYRLEVYLSERQVTRSGRRTELEGNLAELRESLADLEREANRAGVPQAWRR